MPRSILRRRVLASVPVALLLGVLSAATVVAEGPPPGLDSARRGDVVPEERIDPSGGDGHRVAPPPGVDALQPGDPVPERSKPESPPANERPADLPPWLDTLQPGDPVLERSKPESPPANERPADLPPWLDALQPGDPVLERSKPEPPPADERPADLPPWLDALQPGDPVPERSKPEPPPADERPADLPPWLDALQRDDPVDDQSASPARAVAAPSPVDLRVTDSEEGVSLAWDAGRGGGRLQGGVPRARDGRLARRRLCVAPHELHRGRSRLQHDIRVPGTPPWGRCSAFADGRRRLGRRVN